MTFNVTKMRIDAETAQDLLDQHNTNNYRKPNKAAIEKYAKAMRSGKWHSESSHITIASTGVLVDGQHRLHAIILADVVLDMIVVTDAAPESVYTFDTHKRRTMADHCQVASDYITAIKVLLRSAGKHTTDIVEDVDFFQSHLNGKLGRFYTRLKRIHGKPQAGDPFTSWGVRGALIVAVLNGIITQKEALAIFQDLVTFRKVKVRNTADEYKHMVPSSERAKVQAKLPPLMSHLVDVLDAGKLPVWQAKGDKWVDTPYKDARDKAQNLMRVVLQAVSNDTKNNTHFAKPNEVLALNALGLK